MGRGCAHKARIGESVAKRKTQLRNMRAEARRRGRSRHGSCVFRYYIFFRDLGLRAREGGASSGSTYPPTERTGGGTAARATRRHVRPSRPSAPFPLDHGQGTGQPAQPCTRPSRGDDSCRWVTIADRRVTIARHGVMIAGDDSRGGRGDDWGDGLGDGSGGG